MKYTFKVGDAVAYSAAFGRSVGLDYDAMKARGVVVAVRPLGENQLVEIDWRGADLPGKVLACHLAKPGSAAFADPNA